MRSLEPANRETSKLTVQRKAPRAITKQSKTQEKKKGKPQWGKALTSGGQNEMSDPKSNPTRQQKNHKTRLSPDGQSPNRRQATS